MGRKGSVSCKKVLKITIFLMLGYILYFVIGMLAPFLHMKSVGSDYKNSIDVSSFYGQNHKNVHEYAKIIESNKEALDVRIDMIKRAKKEIILSTFDIREGDSTTDIFSAMTEAADRGVKVKVLVDGLYGTLHMGGRDMFHAFGSHPNVEIRFYNTPNLLKPWTVHGCLHDKYLVVDEQFLLMGGRNNFDYFLGEQKKGKSVGLDREILIFDKKPEKESSVYQVKTYFRKVWNLDVCKTKFHKWSEKKRTPQIQNLRKHAKEKQYPSYDYEKETVAIEKATLVTNPIHIYGKEPYVWETLKQLMVSADQRVLIHSPYAVFSEEMYKGMKEIKRKVPDTTMILNSIASGDNICASADYKMNRKNIVDTGITIYEYMGKYSTHGKSMVIDDDIAVVGSYNFDCRSTYVDTETMLVVCGKEITRQLEKNLNSLKDDSLKVNKNGTYQKDPDVKERVLHKKKEQSITFLSYIIQKFRYLI